MTAVGLRCLLTTTVPTTNSESLVGKPVLVDRGEDVFDRGVVRHHGTTEFASGCVELHVCCASCIWISWSDCKVVFAALCVSRHVRACTCTVCLAITPALWLVSMLAGCRFCGSCPLRTWVGVELERPTGLNNGSVRGKAYFTCPESHGVFVPEKAIVAVGQDQIESAASGGDVEGVGYLRQQNHQRTRRRASVGGPKSRVSQRGGGSANAGQEQPSCLRYPVDPVLIDQNTFVALDPSVELDGGKLRAERIYLESLYEVRSALQFTHHAKNVLNISLL